MHARVQLEKKRATRKSDSIDDGAAHKNSRIGRRKRDKITSTEKNKLTTHMRVERKLDEETRNHRRHHRQRRRRK